jgi:hypothetical protein
MPREKPGYRDTLELLKELYPGQIMIPVKEAGKVLGGKCENTVRKYVTVTNGMVRLVELAHKMS